MIKVIYTLIVVLAVFSSCDNSNKDRRKEIDVEAKIWSKIDGVNIYSDWTTFKAITVDNLDGFDDGIIEDLNQYGSCRDIQSESTGFFRLQKINDRWWLIDPEGYGNINVSVTSMRKGSSERNMAELEKKFGNDEKWITDTHKLLIETGFNGTGSWSDVPMIRYSNTKSDKPLVYTMMWNFYSSYSSYMKESGKGKVTFDVFSPSFEDYSFIHAKQLLETADDPNLLGHFSDNELPFGLGTIDEYLDLEDKTDPNYLAASQFLAKYDINRSELDDSLRNEFLGIAADRYYSVVSRAIKNYDPNHLYLGSRLHGRPKNTESIIRAISPYADIISINYYGNWEPSENHFYNWMKWSDKPVMITEFYTKAMDSGLPNNSGAGWIVKTQNDRGLHYENFCLKLLCMKNCVGWNWFRYIDNDPTDTTSDPSNNDSNKGLVDNYYNVYIDLTKHMKAVNFNRYRLIRYFDTRER